MWRVLSDALHEVLLVHPGRSAELAIPSKPGSECGEELIENPEKENCFERQVQVSQERGVR